MYNEVEVKAILIAVHNIENVGLNSKKVLLNSIEWLRCQYEITQDESFLIKAVWHIYAYLELGYPYISGELEFNRILNCLQLDINTVFPKKGWAYKKVALKKSNINQILGRWHPHFQSMKIEAAILDIIDKVENKKIGSFIYHCGKMLEQKDNKALWEKTFKSDFVLAAGLITFITVFLMIFSMKYYMKLRIKDYTTFIVLGMKKKTSYLLLLVEYTVGCVFSLVFGILMGNGILYGAQTALHKLYPEFLKVTAPGWKIYRNTCGMSVANMTGVFLILLVWMDGRNLSTLISKSEYNEKRPVGKKWILMVLIGIGVLVLGENQYQGSDLSYMYSHVIFIVGLFLVAAFGVALILEGLKHRKQFYHRHILQMNQLYSKYMNNLLILLILLVIHFFALTYLTVEIAEVLPLDKYRENYPYDMVWMAKEEDEAFAEKLVRKYDGNMTELPMIRVTTYYGAQHIGVSASEYEKLTGKDVNLSEREILVGIEDSEYQKEKKITDEDYLNTYSFLFTGKYQEDMAEISHTDPQYLYDIKDIFTQNVIGQYSTDQWHENIIVFSDTYFQKQWEAMRGDDQEATVLRLFTFSGKRKENAWKELSEYQKECGVKNDSDTRMESYLYGTEEYLIGQKMRVLFSLSSKLFLMMALFISAFFVNGIKILSELSGYERRYEFLRCMGMKQKQRRKTIRFETQMLSDIALFATVMMGIVYVLSYEWRCASKDAGSLDVTFWMYWILIVGIYLLADRLVQWLFAQYVIKRVEKGND